MGQSLVSTCDAGVLVGGRDLIGSKRSPSLGREPHGNLLARRFDVNALDLLGL
jgi:hypothetical protein